MRFSSCFAALAAFVTAASAVPSLLDPLDPAKPFGAVYFITNSLDENFVVAAQIGYDGILTDVKTASAHGAGAEGRPHNLGSLFSQGAVEVNQATGRLAVVNAGSATVQIFNIDPKNPTNITPAGKPVHSGGDFPQSIAWNNAGTKLCVLNGGLKSNVQCFLVDKQGALTAVGVGEIATYNQTANPPMGPAGTASQVIFTADQGGVIAIAKGIPSDFEKYPGYFRVWPLADNGTIAETPFQINITQPTGGLTFSLSQAPGRLVYIASDATNGGMVVDFTAGPGNAVMKPIDIPNNKGNCWSVTAPKTGTFFVSDLLNNYINELKLDENNNATLVRQYPVPGMGPNEAVVADIQGTEYMFMLMESARSIGVWRLDGPGEAVLTQLWEVAIPVEISGVNFDTLLVSGMGIYISP